MYILHLSIKIEGDTSIRINSSMIKLMAITFLELLLWWAVSWIHPMVSEVELQFYF